MKRNRISAVGMCLVMTISMLAGCQGKTGSTASTGASAAEPQTAAPGQDAQTEERIPLTFLTNVNVDTEGYDINDSPYIKFLEDKFNVDLTIISESSKYPDKVNTIMASGDLPDYLMLTNKESFSRWAAEGMLMDITDKVGEYDNLKNEISQLGWNLSSYEGRIYGVPLLRYDQTPMTLFCNKTFMDNLKINPEDVKTVEDWHEMLRRFTFEDPDGNGIDDTYGILASDNDYSLPVRAFLDAFDAATNKYVNGEYIPYYLTDEYKEYLKFMNGLYKEGIIDPEYVVTTGQQRWDKAVSNKYGCFLWFWMTTELRTMAYDLENLVPMAPPLKADKTQSKVRYENPVRNYTAITKNCKYPEKVLEILDWGCSEEGGKFVFAGIEGLDYEQTGDKVNIKEDRRGKNTSLRFIILGTQRPNVNTPLLEDLMLQAFGETSLEALKVSNEYGMVDEVGLSVPYFPELAMYDLTQPVKEFRDKAIMGTVNLENDWDTYVADYRRAGGEEQIKLMTEWYEKEYKKQ
ncbi:MAG: extracellular solute-binding protein [Clostridiaceae bacterium]|nr:extracellular solute-binding protein [Clostridiaceae bacterium]